MIDTLTQILPTKAAQLVALVGGIVFLWAVIIGTMFAARKHARKKQLREATEYLLLQVTQTSHGDTQTSETEQVRMFEDLIHSIITDKKPIIFEIAVPSEGTDIVFFVSVPREYVDMVKNQIRRVFERSQVQEVPDYTIFHRDGSSILADVTLKKFFGLPVRTYKTLNTDSFAPIIGVFAAIKEEHTGMALQLVLQKAPKRVTGEIKGVIKKLKSGKKLKHIKPETATDRIGGLIASTEKKDEGEMSDSKDAQMLEEKAREQLYRANIRIGVCTPNETKTDLIYDSLQSRFDQFSSTEHNSFSFTKRKDRKMILNFAFRMRNEETMTVLSAEEIASIFHLPSQPIEVSNMQWMKTKRVAAPTELPNEGLLLGDNIFHGQQTEVYMLDKDRMRHLYIIGQTGTGKTAIMQSMVYQDIQSGKGACIIDPHGDFVDDMLAVVPKHRVDDVIVFDPSNFEHPLALNMLEYDRSRPQEKTFIVDEILSIFYNLFDKETMGPVFEQYMRNSLLLLMEGAKDVPATLMDVPRVLTDVDFRADMLKRCDNEPVKRFWEEEAQKAGGDAALENIAPYITSKFSNFVSNDYVRPIISQPHSSFSFRNIMDEGKLLFVKLPQGKIGTLNAGLLGMITTGKIALAAFSRDDTPKDQRQDFYLYIDEFQNFTSDSISKILSESRKYHLGLILGHQYMEQLTDDIRGAVLGNVGSVISFRVGVSDAEVLEKKFTPHFSAVELTETENLNCVVSMLSNEKPMNPFTMHIRFAPRGSAKIREQIVKYSSLKYGGEKERGKQNAPKQSEHSQSLPPKSARFEPSFEQNNDEDNPVFPVRSHKVRSERDEVREYGAQDDTRELSRPDDIKSPFTQSDDHPPFRRRSRRPSEPDRHDTKPNDVPRRRGAVADEDHRHDADRSRRQFIPTADRTDRHSEPPESTDAPKHRMPTHRDGEHRPRNKKDRADWHRNRTDHRRDSDTNRPRRQLPSRQPARAQNSDTITANRTRPVSTQ